MQICGWYLEQLVSFGEQTWDYKPNSAKKTDEQFTESVSAGGQSILIWGAHFRPVNTCWISKSRQRCDVFDKELYTSYCPSQNSYDTSHLNQLQSLGI